MCSVQQHQVSPAKRTSSTSPSSRPPMVHSGHRHLRLAWQTLPSACGFIFRMV
uniref:Uncharacterized protein n=1 Tax=Anguilla anguilla TaxID=7936 RepID=A0A0E9SGI5_ANGAN